MVDTVEIRQQELEKAKAVHRKRAAQETTEGVGTESASSSKRKSRATSTQLMPFFRELVPRF